MERLRSEFIGVEELTGGKEAMLEKPLLLMLSKASSEKAVSWAQDHPSGGATDPRMLAVLSCLPGCAWSCSLGYPEHQSGEAGRVPPTLHLAPFAFRELPPVPFSLSRQTSDSLVLLGLSPGPPHQNHMALSDVAFWELGNAWQT